jgi:hypothetical protein
LGTPKTGDWENTHFDVLEIGERGWAYAVRLSDGIFGWLPYAYTVKVEEDPAPICADAIDKATRLFEEMNDACVKEVMLPGEEPWQVPGPDAPKLDSAEEAADLAKAWIKKWDPEKQEKDASDNAEPEKRAERAPRERRRARCLSPDQAAQYLGIPDDD